MAYTKDSHTTVENIQYDETQLSAKGDIFDIRDVWMPTVDKWSPVYTHLMSPFSFDHFTSPRLPIDLGRFNIDFISKVPRTLRLTIKPVGELTAYVPSELEEAVPFLKQVLEYERMINPRFEDCEVHITTDYGFVQAQESQRFPGWHVDGLQGGKFKEKLQAEHSYVIATKYSTEFCLQPFFIKHYNEDFTNLFKAFDQQYNPVNVYRGLEQHLYLMDAYMVHRTPTIPEDTHRGFIRITVANSPLPIEYNTLNPMLAQKRPDFKLDIRDWLREPDYGIFYDYYGLETKVSQGENSLPPENVQEQRKKAKQDIGTFEDKPLTEGKVLTIKDKGFPKVQPYSPTYRDMVEPFEPKKYTNPRIPIDLGTANTEKIQSCPNVLRMPLKWTGEDKVHVPQEFLPLKPLIERIFSYDRTHNPLFLEQVAHITHDSRIVEPGKTHRFPGFHGDDLQGGSFTEKEIAAHSYILTTGVGTEFCFQPFFVSHVDDTHERLFTEFDKQASEENIYSVRSGHIYLMDPYAVHRTPLNAGEGLRTFLRITFSTKNMLLPYNTINPMMSEYQEEYNSLPVPHLNETWWTQESDKTIPYRMYGLDTPQR